MNGDDVLYSTVGRARRENTESTTKGSSPGGRRFRGPRVSSFVHGFGREGEGCNVGRESIEDGTEAPFRLSLVVPMMGMLER